MKKTVKRILTSLLCLVMIITAIPLGGGVGMDLSDLFSMKALADETDTPVTYYVEFYCDDMFISGQAVSAGSVISIPEAPYKKGYEFIGWFDIDGDKVPLGMPEKNIIFYAVYRKSGTITSYKRGDIIEFGWYPQSKVTDSSIISELNSLAGDNKSWTSYGYYSGTGSQFDGKMKPGDYMRYKDVMYGSNKYRGVVFDIYRPYSTGHQGFPSTLNGYYILTVYWFKYEPLKWRVLDPNVGMVMAETILDSQAYNNYILNSGTDEYGNVACWGDSSKTYYSNNYVKSSIREWLNKDFYNTAFSTAQQDIIEYTALDNSAYSDSYSAYDSEITYDKIYLLSWNDILNTDYGFSSSYSVYDTARMAHGSDYAACQGLYVDTDESNSGNSYWRLRSAGYSSGCICYVDCDGDVNSGSIANYHYEGVRPALNFNLTSEIFQSDVKDTGKSTADGSTLSINSSEYAIFVNDINGNPVEGAKITWNSDSALTDINGKAIFDRSTAGQPLITVEKDGYLKYTNENINYSKSSKGYEFITLYEDVTGNKLKLKSAKYSSSIIDLWLSDLLSTTKRVPIKENSKFSIICVANDPLFAIKYELYQNDNLIDTSKIGIFKDVLSSSFKKGGGVKVRVYSNDTNYVDTPLNLVFERDKVNDGTGFSIGNKIEFTIDDDVPFIGGSTLKMDFPVLPIDISVNENDEGETTVHVGINADIYGAEKDEESGNWTKEEKESFKEKQENKIKDIQKALSTMESWYLRSTNPDGNSLKEIKNLCEDISKPEIPGLNKVNVSFLGYGEGVWNADSEFSEVKVTAYMIVEATVVDRTFQNFAPIGPFVIPVVFNVTVKGEGKAGAEFSYKVDTKTFNGDFKLKLSAGLNMFGGIGIGKAVGVGGYGDAALDTEIQLVGTTNNTGLNSVDLTGEAGFKAYLAIWSYEKPWAHRTWNLYTRNKNPKNVSTQSLPTDDNSVYDIGMYSLQDLSYLSDESAWFGENTLYTSAVSAGDVKTLISNTYRDSRPMIVSAGDTMVMVYTGSDSSRSVYNHTRVMYSVYNATNNSWSTPKQLDSNNTLDMTPYLYSDETNIYVVYSDATRVFSESDDMETILTSQNIVVSEFNFASNKFNEPEIGVAADGNYNSVPAIATVNGEPVIVYQSNASADVFGTNSDNAIIKVTLDGSKETVAANLNSIVGYSIGNKGVAYIIDSDNVLSTCDDRLLYINGEFVEAGVVSNPQFANNGKLYWYSNGTVKEYDNGINEIYPEGIIGFTDSFKVLNNKIVYLSSTSADTSDIMQLSFENGSWSAPVQLTTQDKIIDTFSATEFDGEIITVMTRRDVTITETEVIDECEIAWSVIEDRYDICVDYVDYEHDDVKPDSNLNVTAGITNKGIKEIKKIDVKITNSAGNVVYSENQDVSIMPSESYDLTAIIPIGETVTFDEYTVAVTEIGTNDFDTSDNQCKVSIGYTKFDVSATNLIIGDSQDLVVYVKNSGYTASGGILNIYNSIDESTPVYTCDIDEVSFEEQVVCRINVTEDLLGGKAGKLYIEFVPDIEQFNIFSNKADAYFELCNHDNVGDWEMKTNATCTQSGEKVRRCMDCSIAVEYEEIAQTGHGVKEAVTIAATCTEAGETYEICSDCGEILGDITEITSDGHKPGQWQIITEATVYHEGYEVLNCGICNELLEEKVVPKKTSYTVNWIVDGEETVHTYEPGEIIVVPNAPVKEGYVFAGWTPAVPETMPAYDLTFTAVFEKSYVCPDCGNEIIGEDAINEHIASESRIKATVKIKNNPRDKTINYGETLRLTAITTDMPIGAKIYWYVNGEKRGEGTTFDVTISKGSVEVTVKLVDTNGIVLKDKNGNEVFDTETVSVNSSFWQKIVSFFKNLFGFNRTVTQSVFKGIF